MWELFFIKIFLNKDESKFVFPKFASQIALEVVTYNNTDSSKKKNFNDYTINCYLNDDIFFTRKVDEFINLVESSIYDDNKINEFCELESNIPKEEEKEKRSSYFYLTIVFGISTIVLLIFMIYFIIMANKNKLIEINNGDNLLLIN
jgi:ATP-dependent Zn protease